MNSTPNTACKLDGDGVRVVGYMGVHGGVMEQVRYLFNDECYVLFRQRV